VKTFETNKELRGALEKAFRGKIDDRLFDESIDGRYAPYDEADFEEVLQKIRSKTGYGQQRDAKVRKPRNGGIPEVLRAIGEEVSLWQEVRLHQIESQVARARTRLLHTSEVLELVQPNEFVSSFFNREGLTIRPAYIALFLERHVLRQDYGELLETMQPNDEEYFLAVVAFVMNTAYLSGGEAIQYILTGERIVVPGLFNPTIVLMTYRLVLCLQPPGRPRRSLLSERELALIRLVGTASGRPKWSDLCGRWNREHPDCSYISWRLFRKAFVRARERLLNSYNMAFMYEHKAAEGPEALWRWLEETTAKASGQT
jgi:hypothetical protein